MYDCSGMRGLKEIYLRECEISKKGGALLVSSLGNSKNIEYLNLKGNLLGWQPEILSAYYALLSNTCIKTLIISDTCLYDISQLQVRLSSLSV